MAAAAGGWLLQLVVVGGALLYIFSKGAKFSLFKVRSWRLGGGGVGAATGCRCAVLLWCDRTRRVSGCLACIKPTPARATACGGDGLHHAG